MPYYFWAHNMHVNTMVYNLVPWYMSVYSVWEHRSTVLLSQYCLKKTACNRKRKEHSSNMWQMRPSDACSANIHDADAGRRLKGKWCEENTVDFSSFCWVLWYESVMSLHWLQKEANVSVWENLSLLVQYISVPHAYRLTAVLQFMA